jgi:hypothetical protein
MWLIKLLCKVSVTLRLKAQLVMQMDILTIPKHQISNWKRAVSCEQMDGHNETTAPFW